MIMSMTLAFLGLQEEITLRSVSQSVVNFKPATTFADSQILAVVQPAEREKLQKDKYDFSNKIIQVHTENILNINDLIIIKNDIYLIKELNDFSEYGFFEAIAEEQKN